MHPAIWFSRALGVRNGSPTWCQRMDESVGHNVVRRIVILPLEPRRHITAERDTESDLCVWLLYSRGRVGSLGIGVDLIYEKRLHCVKVSRGVKSARVS